MQVFVLCCLVAVATCQFDIDFDEKIGNRFDFNFDKLANRNRARPTSGSATTRNGFNFVTRDFDELAKGNRAQSTEAPRARTTARKFGGFGTDFSLKSLAPFNSNLLNNNNVGSASSTAAPITTTVSPAPNTEVPGEVRLQEAVPKRNNPRKSVTKSTVNRAIAAIRKLVDDNREIGKIQQVIHPFNAGLLRLGFHDCVGGCDGCINHQNEANAGLSLYTFKLDELYLEEFYGLFSRADFYALAAITAAKYAVELAPCDGEVCDLNIEFQWGRDDCKDPNSHNHAFPEFHGDSEQFFRGRFNMNQEEYVAILGAHSIGKVHDKFSTDLTWTTTQNQLDNKYHQLLLDSEAGWRKSNRSNPDLKESWVRGDGTLVMLGSDIALVSVLDTIAEKCETDFTQCAASRNRAVVQQYANDNDKFLTNFAKAMQKMLSKTANNAVLRDIVDDGEEEDVHSDPFAAFQGSLFSNNFGKK